MTVSDCPGGCGQTKVITCQVEEGGTGHKRLHDGVHEAPVASVAEAPGLQRLGLVVECVALQERGHFCLSPAEAHWADQVSLPVAGSSKARLVREVSRVRVDGGCRLCRPGAVLAGLRIGVKEAGPRPRRCWDLLANVRK